jgi:hypothetical protein
MQNPVCITPIWKAVCVHYIPLLNTYADCTSASCTYKSAQTVQYRWRCILWRCICINPTNDQLSTCRRHIYQCTQTHPYTYAMLQCCEQCTTWNLWEDVWCLAGDCERKTHNPHTQLHYTTAPISYKSKFKNENDVGSHKMYKISRFFHTWTMPEQAFYWLGNNDRSLTRFDGHKLQVPKLC